jgi:hypothetical protein
MRRLAPTPQPSSRHRRADFESVANPEFKLPGNRHAAQSWRAVTTIGGIG